MAREFGADRPQVGASGSALRTSVAANRRVGFKRSIATGAGGSRLKLRVPGRRRIATGFVTALAHAANAAVNRRLAAPASLGETGRRSGQ